MNLLSIYYQGISGQAKSVVGILSMNVEVRPIGHYDTKAITEL